MEAVKQIPIEKVCDKLGVLYNDFNHITCLMYKHQSDSTPSMKFYKDSNSFHCFGCKAGGSTLDFVMGVKNWPRGRALAFLEKEFLNKRSYRIENKQKSSTSTTLANLQKRRSTKTETPFSASALKSVLYAFITREAEGMSHQPSGYLVKVSDTLIDECFTVVDGIREDSSAKVCEHVSLEVKWRLRFARDFLTDFEDSFGWAEKRGADTGDTSSGN